MKSPLIHNRYSVFFILLINLFFQSEKVFSFQDSLRVTLCVDSDDYCHDHPGYLKTIEHFDSSGKIMEVNHFRYFDCDGQHDSDWIRTTDSYFIFDSSGKLLLSVDSSFINSAITVYNQMAYVYDSNGNIISKINTGGNPGSPQNYTRDLYSYDSNQNKITEINQRWDNVSSSFDTVTYRFTIFDSLNHNIYFSYTSWDMTGFSWQGTYRYYSVYDTSGNLINSYSFSNNSNTYFDSSRTLNSFDVFNYKTESLYETWDTTQLSWVKSNRSIYEYDSLFILKSIYYMNCPDTSCSDTSNKVEYTYDQYGHLTNTDYAEYDGVFNGHVYWIHTGSEWKYYNDNNKIIDEGSGWVNFSGCDESDRVTYEYNTVDQLIHSRSEYLQCNYSSEDCYYNNLNNDSLILTVNPLTQFCPFDTIHVPITLAGGHPPYLFQWTPSTNLSNANILSPAIVTDTNINYTLSVTDSNGLSKNIYVFVNVFPKNIHPVSIIPFGAPCENELFLTFNADSLLSPWTYDWWLGSYQLFSTGDTLPISISGNYSLRIVDLSNNCELISEKDSITIYSRPIVFLGNDTLVCVSQSLVLNAANNFDYYEWNDGTHNQTLIATGSGPEVFYVNIVDSNGCNAQDTININFDVCSFINQLEVEDHTLVFPNPAADEVTVEIQNNFTVNSFIRFYDIAGELILQQNIARPIQKVDVSFFSKGFYFYEMFSDSQKIGNGKLIIR